jgi:hypothetical protein
VTRLRKNLEMVLVPRLAGLDAVAELDPADVGEHVAVVQAWPTNSLSPASKPHFATREQCSGQFPFCLLMAKGRTRHTVCLIAPVNFDLRLRARYATDLEQGGPLVRLT